MVVNRPHTGIMAVGIPITHHANKAMYEVPMENNITL